MQIDNVRKTLRDDIVNCIHQPGTTLLETELSQRYGCGRTKIRDALLVLAGEDFVALKANKGAVVAPLDASHVYSIFEMRIALEKAVAVLASKRIDPTTSEKLGLFRAKIEKSQSTSDAELFYETDREVHQILSDACCNPFLQKQLYLMRLHTRRCWSFYKDRGLRETEDYVGLIQVIDAVCANNTERAGRAMFGHISKYHDAFTRMLSEQMSGLEHL